MKTIIESPHALATLDAQGVATLTLQNAKLLNILGTPVIADLTHALAELAQISEIRVLILRGTGDKAFVAGANIVEMSSLTRATAEHFIKGLRDLCEAVRRTPVPVIARIPGWALGAGLELATACDIRIASRTAQFGMPEVKVGLRPIVSGHAAVEPRLPQREPDRAGSDLVRLAIQGRARWCIRVVPDRPGCRHDALWLRRR